MAERTIISDTLDSEITASKLLHNQSSINVISEADKKEFAHKYTIGVYVTNHLDNGLNNPFFSEIISGIGKVCSNLDCNFVMFTHNWEDTYNYNENSKKENLDGCIMIGMARNNPNIVQQINSKTPTVFVDLDIIGKRTSYIISDNVQGAKTAVNYLFKLGHRKIGMIMGQWITKPAQDRMVGFQKQKNILNLVNKSDWIIESDFSEQGGYNAMNKILKLENFPTAIFCQSDSIAIGAIKAIKESNYKVPLDFSIIGFDDIEMSKHLDPPLTTIKQNKDIMGEKAAELLFNIIESNSKDYFPLVLPVELVERSSCRAVCDKI